MLYQGISLLQKGGFPGCFTHMAQGKIFLELSDKVAFLFPVANIQHQHKIESKCNRAIKALCSWVTAYSSTAEKSFVTVVLWVCGWTQIPQNVAEKCLHFSCNIQHELYFTIHLQHWKAPDSNCRAQTQMAKCFLFLMRSTQSVQTNLSSNLS